MDTCREGEINGGMDSKGNLHNSYNLTEARLCAVFRCDQRFQ